MRSTRRGREKKLEPSDHVLKLRQRLQEALSLGIRLCGNKVKRWQCIDAEIQLHALRAMATFIDCISCANMQHFLIKDSIADMLVAFEGILQSENEKILSVTMKELLKLLNILGTFIRQFDMVEVIFSLSQLLRFLRSTITIPCVIALNDILTNLGQMRSKSYIEIWKAVENTNAIGNILLALQDNELSSDYFKIMTSLLKTILWKWPPSRYHVWSNNTLMAKLGQRLSDPDLNFSVCALQIYSALALCGNRTMVLLENEELLSKVVLAFESSQSFNLRVQALKISQHLLRSQEGCSKLTGTYCESIVQGIVTAMTECQLSVSKKVSAEHMLIVKEACKAALMVRWAGSHQSYFWKYELDRVLLEILIGNTCTSFFNRMTFQPEEVIAEICDSSIEIRPYIWDIIGWLAVHCPEDFVPKVQGKSSCFDAVVNITCSVAHKLLQKKQESLSRHLHEFEPVSRAVLLMVFSPCTYISSLAKTYVLQGVRICDDEYLGRLLNSLMLISRGDVNPLSDRLQTVINLITIACYSTLTQYQHLLVKKKAIEILLAIIRRCLNTEMHINRSSFASHLNGVSDEKLCCWSNTDDWEGGNLVIFYCLQALSQLIPFSNLICNHPKIISRKYVFSNTYGGSEAEPLLKSLRGILDNDISSGTRWYAGCLFSFFGLYGFPSKLGKRMKAAFDENELADLQYVLSNGQRLTVHSTILMAGCPFLLPSKEAFMDNKLDGGSLADSRQHKRIIKHEVKVSEHTNGIALAKIIEYVYTGFIIVEDDMVKPLRSLAKHCGLKYLVHMFSHRLPRWGTSVPSCDFSQLLQPTQRHFSDIILVADKTTGMDGTCTSCGLSRSHVHAHKIILWSNCKYFQALYRSGMQDSHLEKIKVPVGWKALNKLVNWFYSGKLPQINLDCNWNNMPKSQQLHELQAYVELSSLAEFWLLEEVKEESFSEILSCLEMNQNLSKEIINFASDLGQWKIVEAAVTNIVPLYPKLRDAGALEKYSEEVVDMLRLEYVRRSQNLEGF